MSETLIVHTLSIVTHIQSILFVTTQSQVRLVFSMSTSYVYEPADFPVVGGYSATFNKFQRNIGRGTAIEATKRILLEQDKQYEPTGDRAFDLRAEALRTAFRLGTPQAYEESHNAFLSLGLYSHELIELLIIGTGKEHMVTSPREITDMR